MNTENKCFFSISLENGITITGNNPNEVMHFLSEISIMCGDSLKLEDNQKHVGWIDCVKAYKKMFDSAWSTIYWNMEGGRK